MALNGDFRPVVYCGFPAPRSQCLHLCLPPPPICSQSLSTGRGVPSVTRQGWGIPWQPITKPGNTSSESRSVGRRSPPTPKPSPRGMPPPPPRQYATASGFLYHSLKITFFPYSLYEGPRYLNLSNSNAYNMYVLVIQGS